MVLCYSLETWKMLSGVKFIPRDQVHDEDLDSILKEKKKLDMKREKNKRKGKSSGDSSDDDDELDKIKKRSRKKWYSSDEDSSIYTTESESEKDEKKRRKRVKKKTHDGLSPDSGERSKARSQSSDESIKTDGIAASREARRGAGDARGAETPRSDRIWVVRDAAEHRWSAQSSAEAKISDGIWNGRDARGGTVRRQRRSTGTGGAGGAEAPRSGRIWAFRDAAEHRWSARSSAEARISDGICAAENAAVKRRLERARPGGTVPKRDLRRDLGGREVMSAAIWAAVRDAISAVHRSCKKEYTSEDEDDTSYSYDGSDSFLGRQGKRQMSHRKYGSKSNRIKGETTSGTVDSTSEMEIARKEMGLDWMLRSESKRPAVTETEEKLSEVPVDESKKVNDKELNPYLKDNRCGYPEESDGAKVGNHQFLSSFLVGDGGASWRLKALKRAQEQAAREGQDFLEVLEERWGSLGELTASVASHAAAPARAHLCAVKNRQRGRTKENSSDFDKHGRRDSERQKSQQLVGEGVEIISTAVFSLNKFANDGNFMHAFGSKTSNNSDGSVLESVELEKVSSEVNTPGETMAVVNNEMSAIQLAAKAMQLRLKGKHEEAEKLMEEAKVMNTKQGNQDHTIMPRCEGNSSRYPMQKISAEQKKEEDDADMHLASKIMQNKQFRASTQADDEYDFEECPSRKCRKKQGENPNRPMHLVVSIANFTYLMLPQWQPVVPGHCCILPIQEKEVLFLETVIGLTQQPRHCMVECIPLHVFSL
ncbi:hypothetical protein VNO78_33343 [Psophocarpus tetragonolobus]|uniref:Cwf19-like C-terminal domain-containing protein n=1 Tax=Psophocarpus tetragonolobus TaxID=3891 RepID=A0AAN9RQ20_PSOTE